MAHMMPAVYTHQNWPSCSKADMNSYITKNCKDKHSKQGWLQLCCIYVYKSSITCNIRSIRMLNYSHEFSFRIEVESGVAAER